MEFRLPDIGEGIHEGEIVQWLVQPGDTVKEDQPLVEVMTDKVTAEIPSPVSGVVKELRGKAGDVVKVGSVIVVFDPVGATASAPAAEKQREASHGVANGKTAVKAQTATLSQPARAEKVLAAPATRKLARQLGVDLTLIAGSGPRGRVTPQDVRAAQMGGGVGRPTPQLAPISRGDRRVPFAGMRRKIAEHLVKSKQTAPHFGFVEEVNVTELVKMRAQLSPMVEEKAGVKLNYLPFVIKAVISGLKAYPVLNSQLDEAAQELVYKQDYNIGVAVATDEGLVVPVVKHADQKSLVQLAQEIKDLADRARTGKLSLSDLQGGTFTITSIGSIGGLFGIPIINYPEVAILGVNKITQRPVVKDNQIVIGDVMYLSLSGDHRVVDGAEAALFTKHVVEQLEAPSRLLLDI